jgi:hypothetical protein
MTTSQHTPRQATTNSHVWAGASPTGIRAPLRSGLASLRPRVEPVRSRRRALRSSAAARELVVSGEGGRLVSSGAATAWHDLILYLVALPLRQPSAVTGQPGGAVVSAR